MKHLKDNLTAEDEKLLKEEMSKAREAVNKGDITEIKSAYERLSNLWFQISEKIYKKTGAASGAQNTSAGGASQTSTNEGTQQQEKKSKNADYKVVE